MTPDVFTRLREIRDLRDRGLTGQWVAEARKLAAEAPMSAPAQMEAAYACDTVGDEHEAIRHYDAAWRLGVPEGERRAFAVGYGSTLRNVGRLDEAVTVLAETLVAYPDYAPIKAFLALALHSSGHHQAAMATLLQLVLELADGDDLDGFDRALAEYQAELTRASIDEA